ncbi:MAG: hypothetical protein WD894_03720 [Pirellulales bacterium]
MQAQTPNFSILAIAVGAGLLAVLVLWVSKQIVNEKTRSQGIVAAAIALGVLLLGFFVMPATTVVQMAPATATVTPGVTTESSISMERNGAMEVHVHRGHPTVSAPSAHVTRSGQNVGQAHFAWGPLTIAVIAVGVIAIVVSSKRGMVAALACLGIVAAVLVMYLFAARHSTDVARVAEIAPPAVITEPTREAVAVGPTVSTEAHTAAEESAWDVKAEADTASDEKAEKTSTSDRERIADSRVSESENEPTATPPPAWIDSEPTMESGVYRVAVVSGPYQTKRECRERLERPARNAVQEYFRNYQPNNGGGNWVNAPYIRDQLIEEEYFERVNSSVGPMLNLHVLLRIEQSDVAYFNQLAHQRNVRQAVEETSIGGLFVLGSLVVVYVALRYPCRKKRATAVGSDAPAPPEAAT